jgi:hypothetical protein
MDNSKINHVKKIFVSLKQESYVNGKNLASMNNLAKKSKTSRNNFYEQAEKSEEWCILVEQIKDFKTEFDNYLKIKPSKEEKKKADLCKKIKILMEQNLELINDKNHLYEQINEKNSIIEHLEKRIQILMQIDYNGDKNGK